MVIFFCRGIPFEFTQRKIDILQYCRYYAKNINIIIINIHTNVIVIPRRYLLFVVDLYYGMKLANDNE